MTEVEKDEAREYRIEMEAIADAYGPEEQALGWYYYLACFPRTVKSLVN